MAIDTAQWQLPLHNGNYRCTMAIAAQWQLPPAQWQLTLHNGN